jgi:flagellar hook-basal body complex protein FliE
MAGPIVPVNLSVPPIATPSAVAPGGSGSVGGEAFKAAFTDAVSQVEGFRQNADASVNSFLSGDGEELHEVALKTEQADLSFDLFMQVRNKIVSAYEEVMRMQV